MKRIWSLLLAVLLLCGCGKTEVVKPGFNPATVQEATKSAAQSQHLSCKESFQNADGSVEFDVQIDTILSLEPMAVVEGVCEELTVQDAYDFIYALFPNAECYERHPDYSSPETSWTREELEKNLERWRSYTYEDLIAFYGGVENFPGVMAPNGDEIPYMDYWEDSLASFEELLEKVPEENVRTKTLWHMFKETEYTLGPEEAARMDTSRDRDCVCADVVVDGKQYYYFAANGNPLAGSSNLLSLSYNPPDSPANIDWQIHLSENKALPTPTQEDLNRAKAAAQDILDRLSVGDWVLNDPVPSDHDGTIYINGDPAEPARPSLENVVVSVASYQLPDLSIRFHPDGTLLNLRVGGGLSQIINHAENAAELPVETLLETALNHLKEEKRMTYGISEDDLINAQIWSGEDFQGRITITDAQRRYAGINTSAGGVCNVPCLVLMGAVVYAGIETGKTYDSTNLDLPGGQIPLVVVNAIDGTIIPF